jgi:hypothetical protein
MKTLVLDSFIITNALLALTAKEGRPWRLWKTCAGLRLLVEYSDFLDTDE